MKKTVFLFFSSENSGFPIFFCADQTSSFVSWPAIQLHAVYTVFILFFFPTIIFARQFFVGETSKWTFVSALARMQFHESQHC